MTEKNPKISVIIPAFNAERFIEKCLISLKQQTFNDFEIIVVDDDSKDKTAAIAQKYARVVKNKINLGEGQSRNAGAEEARGDILVYTDADVVTPPHWLENILKTMAQYDVRCVGGGYAGSVGDSFLEKFCCLELEYRRRGLNGFVNTLVANNFACAKDIFLECGGFDGYKCEDLRLSYRISRNHKIYWNKNNGVYHHFRNSLEDYLKQQFCFARDTVWSYFKYPEMFLLRTHQGRQLYFETLSVSIFYFALFIKPFYAFLPLLFVIALNLPFLNFLYKEKMSPLKSLGVIFLRDFICLAGIIVGIFLCLKDLFKKRNYIPDIISRSEKMK